MAPHIPGEYNLWGENDGHRNLKSSALDDCKDFVQLRTFPTNVSERVLKFRGVPEGSVLLLWFHAVAILSTNGSAAFNESCAVIGLKFAIASYRSSNWDAVLSSPLTGGHALDLSGRPARTTPAGTGQRRSVKRCGLVSWGCVELSIAMEIDTCSYVVLRSHNTVTPYTKGPDVILTLYWW